MKLLTVGTSILLLCVPLVLSQTANGTVVGDSELGADVECIQYPEMNSEVAHIGWPFIFDCELIVDELLRYNKTLYDDELRENWICELKFSNGTEVWRTNSTLWTLQNPDTDRYKSAYSSFIVELNMDRNLTMTLYCPKLNFCASIGLYLKPEVDKTGNETCETVKDQLPRINDKLGISGRKTIHCTVPSNVKPDFHFFAEDATYEWFFNCSKNLPSNVILQGNKLVIRDGQFFNAGEYLCAATYNGKRRYAKYHKICVQHMYAGVITIKCPKQVIGEIGQDLNVTCLVDNGIGNDLTKGAFTLSTWRNSTNGTEWTTCKTRSYSHDDGLIDDRIMCESVFTGINGTKKCYHYEPSLEKQRPAVQTFQLTMQIRNLQMWDAGLYNLYFGALWNVFDKNDTVMIVINNERELRYNSRVLAISLSIVVLIIICIALGIWRKYDIKWFFKKYFGEYDIDDKTYMAYLAYHYSTEDMDNKSKEMTENLVKSLYDFMEAIGGRVYDDHRDGDNGQLHIENVSQIQKDCHRIIVILNEEYVTDQWNLHEAYSAIRNMILDGKKVIFIPLPGIQKKFREMANESKTALTKAMQVNTTIKWNGKIPLCSIFRHQLQCSLPKLKKRRNKDVVLENPLIHEAAV